MHAIAEPAGATTGQNLAALPLCVDMDGTLLRIDTLHEAAFAAVFADWRVALKIPGWLADGRPRLKQELARRWTFDAATLPYSHALLAYLSAERDAGRHIVLCTAAHRELAERVAEQSGLFDEVIASDTDRNLRGPAKAAALVEQFGRDGFVYAGNDATDQPVWDAAAGAVVVNAPASVRRTAQARHPDAVVLGDGGSTLRAALRAMRPYQWVKNALCLVPPLAGGGFTDAHAWVGAIAVAAAFCLIASGIYLLNDISDLAADRAHPRKCRRPFASGALPIAVGLALCPLLWLGGAALGWACGALPALAIYLVSSLAYNMRLKEQPLADVFVLALLYTIRLFGGGQASGYPVSLWLLGFSSFLFLSLAMMKRVSELNRLQASGPGRRVLRRGYMAEDAAILQMFGSAATFASAIVLSLYVQSDTATRHYPHAAMLWGSIPLLLFWQCRLWLSTARGYMLDDPIVYAARDWVSWGVFAGLAAVAVTAWLPTLP